MTKLSDQAIEAIEDANEAVDAYTEVTLKDVTVMYSRRFNEDFVLTAGLSDDQREGLIAMGAELQAPGYEHEDHDENTVGLRGGNVRLTGQLRGRYGKAAYGGSIATIKTKVFEDGMVVLTSINVTKAPIPANTAPKSRMVF